MFVQDGWILLVCGPKRLRHGSRTRKKRTRLIPSHFDPATLINNPYLYTVQFLAFDKVKSAYEPSGPSGRSLPRLSSMKRLGVFLLPPGRDASPSQGYPQHKVSRYPFIHLGGEKHCGSKVSCPRTRHNVSGQGLNLDCSIQRH